MSTQPTEDVQLQSLARSVAHDLNNLLGIILNYATLAGQTTAHLPEVSADLAQIRTAAREAAQLSDRLALAADADS